MFSFFLQTEHDFHLEKQRLVVAAKLAMMDEFAKKEKELEVEKKIKESNAAQENSFREMASRQEQMESLRTETLAAIAKAVKSNKGKYSDLLEQLIVESMLKMEEADITVKCRAVDRKVVQPLLAKCLSKYKTDAAKALDARDMAPAAKAAMSAKIDKATVNLSGDGDDLPADCAGGVIISGFRGRIVCDSTLDTRLGYVMEGVLPQVRTLIFGDRDDGEQKS